MPVLPNDSAVVLDMIRTQIEPLANQYDSDRLADKSLNPVEQIPRKSETSVVAASIELSDEETLEPTKKRGKMTILQAASDLHDFKLIEHQLKIKQMTEEHELKMKFIREEHEAKMKILHSKMKKVDRSPLTDIGSENIPPFLSNINSYFYQNQLL